MNEALAWWQALLLGIVQGLTEFLPVSSSGHLALAEAWLDAPGGGVAFAVLLHAGTLLAIVIVFSRPTQELIRGLLELPAQVGRPMADWSANSLLAAKVVVATIPGAIVGLAFSGFVEEAFANTRVVAGYLLVTGAILLATRWAPRGEGAVSWGNAFLIGWAQACAILPGISRSGVTISVAIFLGVGRRRAAEFSFLAAIPLILGSMIMELPGLLGSSEGRVGPLALWFFSSFGVGWVALVWLLRVVRTGRLHWFAGYCLSVGLFVLVAPGF
jgi:undecaprenyl-diphosphatase